MAAGGYIKDGDKKSNNDGNYEIHIKDSNLVAFRH